MNIAIVGAGIGGLAAAILLARARHKVRVFDQFDKPRPLGSGLMLQQPGLAVLKQLGLREKIDTLGSRIDRLWGLNATSGRAVLDVRYATWKQELYGLGVQRSLLFDTLLEAATQAGAVLEPNHFIRGANAMRGEIIRDGGDWIKGFDLTVLAYGARPFADEGQSPGDLPYGALWATLPWPKDGPFDPAALEQRYRKASQMAGVMASGRISENAPLNLTYFWSIRADQEDSWRQAPLADWKTRAQILWPETENLLNQISDHDQLTFARYRHYTHPDPIMGRSLVHIGDCWHATSPQLGQGANMALLDAWALSEGLQTKTTIPDAMSEFRRQRLLHVRLYQTMSWLFTPVYQGDSSILPWLRDWLAAPLSRIWPAPPLLAAMVSGAIGAPLKRLGLRAR